MKQKNIQQKELAKITNTDKRYISEVANYKCLPLPEQADQICKYLGCNILDIYNKKEIDLILGTKRKSNNIDSDIYYRLSVRLNKSSRDCLKKENLNKLGYKTQKEWVIECINELKKRLKEQNNDNK